MFQVALDTVTVHEHVTNLVDVSFDELTLYGSVLL